MSERGDAMCRSRLSLLVSLLRVNEGLAGMLVSRQVILLSLVFANTMGVRSRVM